MTRVKTHNLGLYADCFQLMDKAKAANGLILTFPDSTRATQFRHRCYSARKTLQLRTGDDTPYDSMMIQKEPGNDARLIFSFRSLLDIGATIEFLHPEGAEPLDESDDLVRAARKLVGELKL